MNNIHTCSYSCDRPECIKAQRDELAAAAAREAVAYLDIGAGGYLDIGSDLPEEQLLALPNGRHALGIIGTYGIDGYVSAPVTAAAGIDLTWLRARVVSAIKRITSGAAPMRVPADMTDPDLVLGDVLTLLDTIAPQIDASPKGTLNELFGSAE